MCCWKMVCVVLCLLVATSYTNAQLTPEKALSSFTVAEGLKLELFAGEPMFSNPTCMDVDEKGRVWVCESVNYRTTLRKRPVNRKEGDRIVILQDTKGDGKADKATTFYQAPDFLAPLGIAVSKDPVGPGYKVYVCHSPHIYVFEDKDGDGQADGPPKILLTGFGGVDHDHGVHGIHFGPDGKLYFSVGDQGVKNLKGNDASDGVSSSDKSRAASAPGVATSKSYTTNQTDCKAGTIWRCNTDGSQLELLAHNFRNQYEPAVNSFGTMFVSDNDDDGHQQTRICHVMYGGDYGYWPRNRGDHHWHEDQPGVVHKTLRTGFGSPTGLCWYEGKLLQDTFSRLLAPLSPQGRGAGGEGVSSRGEAQPYEGYLLHTDAGPREVRLFGVRPKGAGYELDKVNLVTSTDNWFRPSDVCVAPDGSVFIADWYDPGVGGHGMGDTTRGRIYRLTNLDESRYPPHAWNLKKRNDLKERSATSTGFYSALSSGNICVRQMAIEMAKIFIEEDQLTASHLLANPLNVEADSLAARSMWPLSLIHGMQPKVDKGRLSKPSSSDHWLQQYIRVYSDRCPDLALQHFTPEVRDRHSVGTLLDIEENNGIAVSREMLLALRLTDYNLSKDWILRLAKKFDGQDRTYLSALNIAVGTDPARREAILADFEKHFPDWNDKTAWLVWELRPPKVIAKLGKKLATEVMTPLQTELALGAMAATSGVDGGESLLKLLDDTKVSRQIRAAALTTLLKYLPGKWSSLKSSFLVQKAIEAQMTDGEMLPAVVELVSVCERKDFQSFLATLANKSTDHSNQIRYAAIAGLAS